MPCYGEVYIAFFESLFHLRNTFVLSTKKGSTLVPDAAFSLFGCKAVGL